MVNLTKKATAETLETRIAKRLEKQNRLIRLILPKRAVK